MIWEFTEGGRNPVYLYSGDPRVASGDKAKHQALWLETTKKTGGPSLVERMTPGFQIG